jgi:hypothetical protein
MTSKTERLSKAKIISAEADVKSAKLMHQAADILNSKAAMQIRYLEILQTISKGGGQKLLFMPLSSSEFDAWKFISLNFDEMFDTIDLIELFDSYGIILEKLIKNPR